MGVTIKEVAACAGVSTATVSHVINGTRYVAEETQNKVKEAIAGLGYIPNISASGLRSNRSKRIGLLVPSISSFFSIDIADAVEQVLRKNGYQLVIGCSHEKIEREKKQMESFVFQQVDGVLMFPAPGDHSYLDEKYGDLPVVFIDREAAGCQRDVIMGDNVQGAYDLVSRMIRFGRRKIGLINGTEGVSALEERVQGYQKALEEAGVLVEEALIQNGGSSISGGYEAAERLLQVKELDAIVSLAPPMTIGCMKRLQECGKRIPEEIALAGFGDMDCAEIANPPITAVSHPMFEMGQAAAQKLLEKLEQGEKEDGQGYERIRLPLELICRKSFS